MNPPRQFALLLVCLALSLQCFAQRETLNVSKLSYADSSINASIAQHDIPGAVLCVVEGDKIVYLKAYGNKEIVPDTVPMTVNTVFDLASLSKCVGTTLSFMQLVEQGK